MSPLAPILQEYFTAYLVTQRAMSQATIRAYRDTWRLLLTFLSGIVQVPAHQLQLTDLDPAHVVAFLEHLEQERGNSTATRNLRLAAIKSVMAFHANRAPERLDTIARINAIPVKKHPKPQMTFLTGAEVQALLDAVPTSTWTNRRDRGASRALDPTIELIAARYRPPVPGYSRWRPGKRAWPGRATRSWR